VWHDGYPLAPFGMVRHFRSLVFRTLQYLFSARRFFPFSFLSLARSGARSPRRHPACDPTVETSRHSPPPFAITIPFFFRVSFTRACTLQENFFSSFPHQLMIAPVEHSLIQVKDRVILGILSFRSFFSGPAPGISVVLSG